MTLRAPATRIERLIATIAHQLINWRKSILVLTVLLSSLLGASALRTHLDAGFNKLIPMSHPYMQAFLEHSSTFSGANRVMVSVKWKGEGDIFNERFLHVLRNVTDEVFFIPGVNRGQLYSLYTPNVRYVEITEDGFVGEVIIPSRFTPDVQGLAQVRSNVAKSGQIGRLVGNDLKSALVRADLLEINPETGDRLDYSDVAKRLEDIRTKFNGPDIEIHIVGFAKVLGDVMEGLVIVISFFAIAFTITALLLLAYSRSLNLTLLALVVALLPVLWLLGLLPLGGYGIDPMSILVPFLIFSIGVSHAVQMTNAWKYEVSMGVDSKNAAKNSFRRLAVPGTLALLTNALGFMVIMLIDIPIVHELGVTACLGVTLMILTNKVILPVALSYLPGQASKDKEPADSIKLHPVWWRVSALAEPKPALITLLVSVLLLVGGTALSRHLLTGDIGAGVPELREESRYNRDNSAIVRDYSIGMDVLSVYAETQNLDEACLNWPVMNAVERFDLTMRGVDGVRSVTTVAGLAKLATGGSNEGNPRWAALQRTEAALRTGAKAANPELGMNNESCKVIHLQLYLKDHEGATLKHVVTEVSKFIEADKTPNVRFRLAGGNAGVAAATNEAVEHAEVNMLAAIFGAIAVLCWLTFRNWRAVLCIVVPLTLVSILCNALMAVAGIGLKVATLPVVALGVGVGVDYGIYLFERIQHEIDDLGATLRHAFYEAMVQRGTAAVFTAITMSIGVGTWFFSALKFQADMGILLAFMFLVNVLGAIFLLPAMACWLGVGKPEKAGKQ
ncbi:MULTISPECIES: RND family transporter [Comamonadaceae]|uniref:efflux RND transporter permease subunit n=1 Tax=Comamonadaceae TaxID=80864 RepID=UPI002727695E|nr:MULTISPECIES: efflux RND transporter permease subunit [Comamonadaceae]MDO9143486.1 efflux RND transporter permease subunit [Rhodoferax sp.]MDP3884969.1 efflux RND transporter permease subunit [Hydrogenophaga sp.]